MKWLAAVLVALAACSSPSRSRLGVGQTASVAPVEIAPRLVARRGALSYQSAFVGTRLWVSTELATRFELVVRRVDRASVLELGRVDLGPSDWNTTGLAAAARGPLVWVSSLAGSVRGIDVTTMTVVREWRVGSHATALAVSASGAHVAYGTSTGALCLRRTSDGALLQCLVTPGPVTALGFDGDSLVGASGKTLHRWSVPTLRRVSEQEIEAPVGVMAASASGLALGLGIATPPAAQTDSQSNRGLQIIAGDQSTSCRGHRGTITAVRWLADGTLASASVDGSVRLWKVSRDAGALTCQPTATRELGQPVWSLARSPSGAHLAVGLWAGGLGEPTAVLADLLYPGAKEP